MRLRPRPRVVIEQPVPVAGQPKTVCLKSQDMRKDGSDDPHDCVICQKRMRIHFDRITPDWAQCPECRDVLHLTCLDKWVAQFSGTAFTCPSCRAAFSTEGYDEEWNADDVVENLRCDDNDFKCQDETKSCQASPKDGSDSNSEEDESESEEDESESEEEKSDSDEEEESDSDEGEESDSDEEDAPSSKWSNRTRSTTDSSCRTRKRARGA